MAKAKLIEGNPKYKLVLSKNEAQVLYAMLDKIGGTPSCDTGDSFTPRDVVNSIHDALEYAGVMRGKPVKFTWEGDPYVYWEENC